MNNANRKNREWFSYSKEIQEFVKDCNKIYANRKS